MGTLSFFRIGVHRVGHQGRLTFWSSPQAGNDARLGILRHGLVMEWAMPKKPKIYLAKMMASVTRPFNGSF